MHIIESPALWGCLGALVYAGPRALAMVALSYRAGKPIIWDMLEAALALVVGAILSEGFGPAIAHSFPWMAEPDGRALFLTVGMVGNPAAPELIKRIQGQLLKRIERQDL